MLYIKEVKNGGIVRTDITQNNVYAKCSKCGHEFRVDLASLFRANSENPYTAEITCPKCTAEFFAKFAVTKEELQKLVSVFGKLGYKGKVIKLLSDYGIKSAAELENAECTIFAFDLLNRISEVRK